MSALQSTPEKHIKSVHPGFIKAMMKIASEKNEFIPIDLDFPTLDEMEMDVPLTFGAPEHFGLEDESEFEQQCLALHQSYH